MGIPWREITAVAATGSALCSVTLRRRGVGELCSVFGIMWMAQAAAWWLWTTFVYARYLSPLRHLPQPPGAHWLLGHFWEIVSTEPGAAYQQWTASVEHEGLLRYMFAFNRERLLVTSPEALGEVLVSKCYDFEKPLTVRNLLAPMLGHGVLLAEGDEHRVQRRRLNPAFHYRQVRGMYSIFWDKARESVEAMTAACNAAGGERVLLVNSMASRTTLDIIGLAGMGVDFGAIGDEANRLAQTYMRLMQPSWQSFAMSVLGGWLPPGVLRRLPMQRNRDLSEAAQTIRSVCRDMVRNKRMQGAGDKTPSQGDDEADIEAEPDLLSVALGSGFSDDVLVDQLMTFLAAGHDTTASALTWVMYLLARHADKQQRLRDEVRAKLAPISAADGMGAVTCSDVEGMPYLRAVCNEALRLFAPIRQTFRQAARDTTIQGLPVRKGTFVVLAPCVTNLDPTLWGPDAADFRPERWLSACPDTPQPEKTDTRPTASGGASSNFAFLTFLHGPRSCIAANFARAELACLVAAWIGRFDFALADASMADAANLRFRRTPSAIPLQGMPLRTRVVDGW
ncbi:hypothetical protein CDD81_5592 [Ophiocordyceps australis]|uniref:Cytochrome P450 n=1 Tax=Ophiocordyceps australis TaxID=1399860 RepID=A0A2C5Y8F4_9HYPO|nr:hypothetical protein CDD81_5592 [Ophiocordyceps australis]